MILIFGGGPISDALTHGLPNTQRLHRSEVDVTDLDEAAWAFKTWHTSTSVIVCAARNPKHGDAWAWRPFHETHNDGVDSWSVNVAGSANVARAAIAAWLPKGVRGSIVLMGSIHGEVSPDPRLYDGAHKPWEYSATKAALPALARYVAAHYGRDGIRCNVLAPGGVDTTSMQSYAHRSPSGRMVPLQGVVSAAKWLCSPDSDGVNGTVVRVDDGWCAV